MPWVLSLLRLLYRLLTFLARKPGGFVTGPTRFRGRWDYFAYYHWILYLLYRVLQSQLARTRGTLAPRSRDECLCCAGIPRGLGQSYISLTQLQEAARQHCIRCSTILKCILKFSGQFQGGLLSEIQIDKRSLVVERNEQYLRLRWPNKSTKLSLYPGHGYITLGLVVLYGERTVSGQAISGREFGLSVPISSRSDFCFQFVQSQIDNCLHHHKSCNSDHQPSFVPKLLLDTRPERLPSSAGIEDIRLVETSSLDTKSIHYSALSYCWGDESNRIKAIPKLTTSTRQDRLRHIPWADLTKTFEDAISITRRLSLRYLWIDALCIMQDDKQDFAEQSGQMALIYGKAYVVISATRAATGDLGIFHDRIGQYGVPYSDTRNRGSLAYVKEVGFHSEFTVNDPANYRRCPVFSRAWCFQERILARRIIHFAENELVWECNEQIKCECGSLSGIVYSGINFKTRQARRFSPLTDTTSVDSELQLRNSLWHECIHTYTSRYLTNESDRLPALSGFAQELYIPQMGRYFAGIWEFQLPSALLWYITHPHLGSRSSWTHRPNDNQAPTWSWSSVQGVIMLWHALHRKIVAKVLDIKSLPLTTDKFGQVRAGAFIILDVPVLNVKLVSYGTTETQWGVRPCGFIELLVPSGSHCKIGGSSNVNKHPYYFLTDLDLETSGHDDHVPAGSHLICAVVEVQGRPEDGNPPKCIILRPHQSHVGQNHDYCRVGIFDCPEQWLGKTIRRSIKIF